MVNKADVTCINTKDLTGTEGDIPKHIVFIKLSAWNMADIQIYLHTVWQM